MAAVLGSSSYLAAGYLEGRCWGPAPARCLNASGLGLLGPRAWPPPGAYAISSATPAAAEPRPRGVKGEKGGKGPGRKSTGGGRAPKDGPAPT